MKWTIVTALSAASVVLGSGLAFAAGQYGPGASDTEIKIGNTMPYSGPASAYGVIGKTEAAYFNMINDQGGINGRKINFISYDDGYSPPKTVEQARKLVESDEVLFIFNSLGTPPNSAIQNYLNEKKVPQLFVATGATKWNDPKHFPWTMGWQPNYQSEGRIYAKYILKNMPNAKIAVLYSERRLRQGLPQGPQDGLGDKADKMIVAERPTRPPNRPSIRTSSRCRRAAPTSSSTSPRRNLRPRRSAKSTTSAGSRRTSSTTCRLRSEPSSSRPGLRKAEASSRRLT